MACEVPLYREAVRAEWGDYNGHLRDAFYGLVFSYATDALMDHIGLDAACRERTQRSIYTLESHVNFLSDVKVGAEVQVSTRLLGADAKRLHVYYTMSLPYRPEHLLAVSEQMLLHVDTLGPKSAVFSPEVMAAVQALASAHAGLAQPAYAGRVMRLP